MCQNTLHTLVSVFILTCKSVIFSHVPQLLYESTDDVQRADNGRLAQRSVLLSLGPQFKVQTRLSEHYFFNLTLLLQHSFAKLDAAVLQTSKHERLSMYETCLIIIKKSPEKNLNLFPFISEKGIHILYRFIAHKKSSFISCNFGGYYFTHNKI